MLNPGDFLENKYRIDELLSRGAFGRVWKAYDMILYRDEDQWILIDLGSAVGTHVDDKRIIKIYLSAGVENITIGTTKCRLILG